MRLLPLTEEGSARFFVLMPQPTDRVRVTITLSREIAGKVDELVDGVRIRNRSHAIESLISDSLDLAEVRQAVILAGGDRTMERIPAIRRALQTLQQHGVFAIIMAVGYLGEQIRQEFGDGSQYGVSLTYSESELGTGGALLQLKSQLKRTFLIVNIDQPVDVDLRNLLKFHAAHQPVVTIATKSLRELGGIYVAEPKLFQAIPPGFCMLEDTVFDELTRQGNLLFYPILTDHS